MIDPFEGNGPTGLTGILLLGGESRRFGSAKALARVGSETLAERAWALLGEACERRLAVGKASDALPLDFDVLDDGFALRAPLAGLVAGLRAASTELCAVVPVDCPLLTVEAVHELAAACLDAAVPQTGPLPGAYRRSVLPILERRLGASELRLRDALAELRVAEVALPAELLLNVNSPEDLERVSAIDSARRRGVPAGERP
jgi:molybdopterin-guanine dinucleotide biosynthesis protein A